MRNGYQHMVQDHYVDMVREMSSQRDKSLREIETVDDVRSYQERVKEAIDEAFSPRPPKTPLKAEVTGTVDRSTHRIEKVLFESRPDCLVSANLYLPSELDGKAPGVIAPCGHTSNGKAGDLYQGFCQRLVNSGFVVLMYDPFNQGERDQYFYLENREKVDSSTHAHNMMGKQMELLGEFFGMWRAWDGVRALDYLLSRPEVDENLIGLTGNSGGGTLTEWLWAVDERFTMAAPSCFITTFLANLENELPQDSEQYPPGIMGRGLEMIDLMVARAPKPVLLLGQEYDYFNKRGLVKAFRDLKHFYKLLGRPEDVQLLVGPHGHGYHEENQRAMVEFFSSKAGVKARRLENTEVVEDGDLWATEDGNVVAQGSKPVFDILADLADRAKSSRRKLEKKALKDRVKGILAIQEFGGVPSYRVLRATGPDEDRFGRYAVETEGTIRAILRRRVLRDEHVNRLEGKEEIDLYLPHVSCEEDIEKGCTSSLDEVFYALDPRGMGESLPEGGKENYFHPYGLDYMYHGFCLLMGRSYLGDRVFDILRTMNLLGEKGADTINLWGRGQGSILALFAGLLHPLTGQVTLQNYPPSFDGWMRVPIVTWPASNVPRGILKELDIPDILESMGPEVELIDPWGPEMNPIGSEGSKDT